MMTTPPVAFFDFDGTLTRGDTLMPFLRYLVGDTTYYRKLALLSPVLGAYLVRLLRNDIAKQVVLRRYLAGYGMDELREAGQNFGRQVIPGMLRPVAMERVEWHQRQGHVCVLVSASLDIYLVDWARDMGFEHVICTSLDCIDGIVTGSLAGSNCFGQEKVEQIRCYLTGLCPERTYAYGDSQGDHFMLDYVDLGFWVRNNGLESVLEGR